MQLTEEKVEYKTIKLILNKIEVKPIRTRKQINKEKKNQKKYSTYNKKQWQTKVSLKKQKRNSRMCISFLLENPDQAKGKPN